MCGGYALVPANTIIVAGSSLCLPPASFGSPCGGYVLAPADVGAVNVCRL